MKKTLMLIFFSGGLVASSLAQIPQSKETIFQLLTGGATNPTGKEWKISASPYKTGVGPITSLEPLYYNFPLGVGNDPRYFEGMLDNSYTFRHDSMYIPKRQSVTVGSDYANRFFGQQRAQYDDVALLDPKHKTAPFKLKSIPGTPGTGFNLDIANGSYLGYFQNRFRYEILKITVDSIYVRQAYSDDAYADPALDGNVRYMTFVAVKPDPKRESILSLLTDGLQVGKTWAMSPSPFKTGIGSVTSTLSEYYDYPDGLEGIAWENGALQNKYTFTSTGQYIPKNTKVTAHWAYANAYLGRTQQQYDDVAIEDPQHKTAAFDVQESTINIGTGYQLIIRDSSYIGYMDKRFRYHIMSIKKDTMYLRHTLNDRFASINPFLDSAARYFTFVKSSLVTSLDSKASNVSETSFYPNPSKDLVTLKEDVSHIIVYNATGEILLKGEKGLLNVASLPTGLYLVKVHYREGNVSWQKLLKE